MLYIVQHILLFLVLLLYLLKSTSGNGNPGNRKMCSLEVENKNGSSARSTVVTGIFSSSRCDSWNGEHSGPQECCDMAGNIDFVTYPGPMIVIGSSEMLLKIKKLWNHMAAAGHDTSTAKHTARLSSSRSYVAIENHKEISLILNLNVGPKAKTGLHHFHETVPTVYQKILMLAALIKDAHDDDHMSRSKSGSGRTSVSSSSSLRKHVAAAAPTAFHNETSSMKSYVWTDFNVLVKYRDHLKGYPDCRKFDEATISFFNITVPLEPNSKHEISLPLESNKGTMNLTGTRMKSRSSVSLLQSLSGSGGRSQRSYGSSSSSSADVRWSKKNISETSFAGGAGAIAKYADIINKRQWRGGTKNNFISSSSSSSSSTSSSSSSSPSSTTRTTMKTASTTLEADILSYPALLQAVPVHRVNETGDPLFPAGAPPEAIWAPTYIQKNDTKEKPYCIVTLVTSIPYFVGANTLLWSLRRNMDASIMAQTDFIALLIEGRPVFNTLAAQSLNGWSIEYTPKIPAKHVENKVFPGYEDLYTQLVIFSWTQYRRVLYIDSDVLAVGDVADFLVLPTLALAAVRDFRNGKFLDSFNAGILSVKPNMTEFDRLMYQKDHNFDYEFHWAEQGLLNNEYVTQARQRNETLWEEWNFTYNGNIAMLAENPLLWRDYVSDMRLIHYTLKKPFKPGRVPGAAHPVMERWQEANRHRIATLSDSSLVNVSEDDPRWKITAFPRRRQHLRGPNNKPLIIQPQLQHPPPNRGVAVPSRNTPSMMVKIVTRQRSTKKVPPIDPERNLPSHSDQP